MGKHTLQELQERQGYSLNLKIALTKQRIRDWVEYYGEDGVFVSFSGGKDSTVLLDIARSMYPNLKACYCDTSLEYPEIVQFVKSFDNVDVVKPKMTFVEVLKKYGYPVISKEVSECVYGARRYLQQIQEEMHQEANKHLTSGCECRDALASKQASKQASKGRITDITTKKWQGSGDIRNRRMSLTSHNRITWNEPIKIQCNIRQGGVRQQVQKTVRTWGI